MPTDFFVIGDSNSAVISRAAQAQGYSFAGGPISPGKLFDGAFYGVEGDRFVLTSSEGAHAPDIYSDLLSYEGPILSTVGFNTQFIGSTVNREMRQIGLEAMNLSDAVIDALVKSWKAPALSFYRLLLERERKFWVCHSPQRFPETYFDLAMRLEKSFEAQLTAMGVEIVDIRAQTTGPDGKLREELYSTIPNDQTHGNIDWAHIMFDAFARKSGLKAEGAPRKATA